MRQLKITNKITVRDTVSFEKYLTEVAKIEVLSNEEEERLGYVIRNSKDQKEIDEAIEKITLANLRFVISVSKQYQGLGMPLPDIINEGNLGLIKAAQRFDVTRGFKFISYAVWWIRQSILQALADYGRPIRLPLNKIGEINKLKKVLAKVQQKFGREATTFEIINEYVEQNLKKNGNINPTKEDIDRELSSNKTQALIDLIEKQSKHVTSVDDFVGNDGDQTTRVSDLIEDYDVEPIMEDQDLTIKLNSIINNLNQRESEVINLFYGLNGKRSHNLDEIGSKLGLTRERARQIRNKSIERMSKIGKKSLVGFNN